MRDVVNFPNIRDQGAIVDETARENRVELRDDVGDATQIRLRPHLLHLLEVVHDFEGKVQVGQQ